MCVLFLNVANKEEDPVPKEKGEENVYTTTISLDSYSPTCWKLSFPLFD